MRCWHARNQRPPSFTLSSPAAARRHHPRQAHRRGTAGQRHVGGHHRHLATRHVHHPLGRRPAPLAPVRATTRPPHPAPRPRNVGAHREGVERQRRQLRQRRRRSRFRFPTTRAARSPSATRRCCSSCCARPRRNRARGCRFRCSGAPSTASSVASSPCWRRRWRCTSRSSSTCARSSGRAAPPIEEVPDRFVSNIVRTPRPAPPRGARHDDRRAHHARAVVGATPAHGAAGVFTAVTPAAHRPPGRAAKASKRRSATAASSR